jgi:uncharacterized membrane protein
MNENPSRWPKRLALAGLALLGFAIALYLSLYQFGVVAIVWEPFFDGGSRQVLHSPLSRMLPVPDATLGALGYFIEIVLVLAGRTDRWRSQRWIVGLYGVVVVSLGVVSFALVIYQATFLNAWCTLCLCSAAVSIAIALLAMNEILSSLRADRLPE